MVLGHSMAHIRQQNFYREVAKLTPVVVVAPDQWLDLRPDPVTDGDFTLVTHPLVWPAWCDPKNRGILHYDAGGLADLVTQHQPDVIYVNEEPESVLVESVHRVSQKLGIPFAIFTWENIFRGHVPELVRDAALVVCGNDWAADIMSQKARKTEILLQVGVDTDHFSARPGVSRNINVGYAGRPVPEKGIGQLGLAYPMAQILPWTDYKYLPWFYSQVKVLVCYSQDSLYWKEQAPPFVAVEGIACGCLVVGSDGGSIPYWAKRHAGRNPAMWVGDDLVSMLGVVTQLGDVERTHIAQLGRTWVEANLGSRVVAQKLVAALRAAIA